MKKKIPNISRSRKLKTAVANALNSTVIKGAAEKGQLKEFTKLLQAQATATYDDYKAIVEKTIIVNNENSKELIGSLLARYTKELSRSQKEITKKQKETNRDNKKEQKRLEIELANKIAAKVERQFLDSNKIKAVSALTKDIRSADFVELASGFDNFIKLYKSELHESEAGAKIVDRLQKDFLASANRLSELLANPESDRSQKENDEIDFILTKIESIKEGKFFETESGKESIKGIVSSFKDSQEYKNAVYAAQFEISIDAKKAAAEKFDKTIKSSLITQMFLNPDKIVKYSFGRMFNSKNGIFGKTSIAIKNITDATTIALTPLYEAIKTSLAARAISKSFNALKTFFSGSFFKGLLDGIAGVISSIFSIKTLIRLMQSPAGLVFLSILGGFFSGYLLPKLKNLYDTMLKPALDYIVNDIWPFLKNDVWPFLEDMYYDFLCPIWEFTKKVFDEYGLLGVAGLVAAIWAAPTLSSLALSALSSILVASLKPILFPAAAATAVGGAGAAATGISVAAGSWYAAILTAVTMAVGYGFSKLFNKISDGEYDRIWQNLWLRIMVNSPQWLKKLIGFDQDRRYPPLTSKMINQSEEWYANGWDKKSKEKWYLDTNNKASSRPTIPDIVSTLQSSINNEVRIPKKPNIVYPYTIPTVASNMIEAAFNSKHSADIGNIPNNYSLDSNNASDQQSLNRKLKDVYALSGTTSNTNMIEAAFNSKHSADIGNIAASNSVSQTNMSTVVEKAVVKAAANNSNQLPLVNFGNTSTGAAAPINNTTITQIMLPTSSPGTAQFGGSSAIPLF